MTQIFNHSAEKSKRLGLRHNMSEPEIILWSCLRKQDMGGHKFRRQYGIGSYVVDFYCPKMRLVIEVDGDSHFTDDAQEYDQIREAYMKSLGIRTIRFKNIEVRNNPNDVLEMIRRTQASSTMGGKKGACFPSLRRRGAGRLERVADQ